jgi:hypothetical protein
MWSSQSLAQRLTTVPGELTIASVAFDSAAAGGRATTRSLKRSLAPNRARRETDRRQVARFRALRADGSTPELLGAKSEQGSRPGEAGLMVALACALPDQRRRSARF